MTDTFSLSVLKSPASTPLKIRVELKGGKYILSVEGVAFEPETWLTSGGALERQSDLVAHYTRQGYAVVSPYFFDEHTAAVTG